MSRMSFVTGMRVDLSECSMVLTLRSPSTGTVVADVDSDADVSEPIGTPWAPSAVDMYGGADALRDPNSPN